MAANGLYNEDGSMRVSVVGGSSGGSAGGTVAQGAAGTDAWLVTARQSGAWTVAIGAGTAAIGSVTVSNFPATQPVSGTFWQTTQPVSIASQPLPAGAATSAKQPALGTAGTSSADVLSVQGIANGALLAVSLPTVAGSPATPRVAVATGTTATQILAAGRSDQMVSLKNTGTVKAYIGGAGVTVANGWPLAVGETFTMDVKVAQGVISAILDTAQATAGEIAVWRF